jgi:hypothetical protein
VEDFWRDIYPLLVFFLLLCLGGMAGTLIGITSLYSSGAAIIVMALLTLFSALATYGLCAYWGGMLTVMGRNTHVSFGWFDGLRPHIIRWSWFVAMLLEVVGALIGYTVTYAPFR